MNDLNAQQVVLLTLFVSFVTSIATGITTVSLLEQTPEPVTQTINRVVEKTIERVVPPEKEEGETVSTPEKEIVTVVVNEEDLTIEAVDRNSRSLARIYSVNNNEKTFLSLGVVYDTEGRLITDSSLIQSKANNLVAVYQTGEFEMEVEYRELNDPYAILKVKNSNGAQFNPAVFSDSQNLKLAQSVISLSGKTNNTVSTGIITSLETSQGALSEEDVDSDTTPSSPLNLIDTSVNPNNVLMGSILLNLQGEIIGVKINGDSLRKTTFLPSNTVKNFISERQQ